MDSEYLALLKALGEYALAYLVTGIISAIFVGSLYRSAQLYYLPDEAKQKSGGGSLAAWVGVVERVLFTSAVIVGKPEFIGVWIVLKAVGEWRPRNPGQVGVSKEFLVAQIGTGLSILAGAGSGFAILVLLGPLPIPKHPLFPM